MPPSRSRGYSFMHVGINSPPSHLRNNFVTHVKPHVFLLLLLVVQVALHGVFQQVKSTCALNTCFKVKCLSQEP